MKRLLETVEPFYLLGMGPRRKFLYQGGQLSDAQTGQVLKRWPVKAAQILPDQYRVEMVTEAGSVSLYEDEQGVWLAEGATEICLSASRIVLPTFEEYQHAALLRVAHQEILVNIVEGRPLPNFLVYRRPWYRDAAMMCMCLAQTGNLDLVRNWINGLDEVFDYNNGGHKEPDNLGQVLYLLSLVADVSHPLVARILETVPNFQKGRYIIGQTDYAEHPVYQTKWLKWGLKALKLADDFEIPTLFDPYSVLFWWDYQNYHVDGPGFSAEMQRLYPYLAWAEAHFRNRALSLPASDRYPVTWEAEASEADYAGMNRVSSTLATHKVATPHTWHAAEMFLYLLDWSQGEKACHKPSCI